MTKIYIVEQTKPNCGDVFMPFISTNIERAKAEALYCSNYIGFELDKHYCEIANERIARALAEKAVGE